MRGTTNSGIMTNDTVSALSGKQDKLPLSGEISLGNNFYMRRWGKYVQICAFNATGTGGAQLTAAADLPICKLYTVAPVVDNNLVQTGTAWIQTNSTSITWNCTAGAQKYLTLVYLTDTDYQP